MTKIIGGTPHGRHDALVDIDDAVLLDAISAVAVHATRRADQDQALVGLNLEGRVNHSTERRDQLYLMDLAGAATIVVEILGLASRAGAFDELDTLIRARMKAMP